MCGWCNLLPANYIPEVTLEQWFMDLDHALHLPDDDPHMIMREARWFVVYKVAEGYRDAPPHILALHLYTCESDLYRNCNRALREGEDLGVWRVFLYYLCQALDSLEPAPPTVLYRGVAQGRCGLAQWLALPGKFGLLTPRCHAPTPPPPMLHTCTPIPGTYPPSPTPSRRHTISHPSHVGWRSQSLVVLLTPGT